MGDVQSGFVGVEKVFLFCAVGGGTLFVLWLVLQFVGAGGHGDASAADVDASHGDVSGDADASFKVLSFQGLTSFFTMFGVVGLALSEQGVHTAVSTLGGTIAGFGMVWVMARLFGFFLRMQSSGTLKMENAVGQEGTVYLKIPSGGTGKAQVTVQNRLMVLDAISEGRVEIPTGARIRVVRVLNGGTLAVVKV